MTDMTLLGVAQAKAKSTKATYQSFFGIILLFEFLSALVLLIIPHRVLDKLGMTHISAEKWLQLVGGLCLFLLLFQVLARRSPLLNRVGNIVNILGRLGLSGLLAYLGGLFLYPAIYMLVTALLLYILFRRMIIGELQTRP